MKRIAFNDVMNNLSEQLIIILLVLLPFHAFIKTALTSVLTQSTVDYLSPGSFIVGAWKEIVIFLILIVLSVKMFVSKKIPFHWTKIDTTIGLFVFLNCIYSFFSPDIRGVIWGIATNVFMFALYFIGRSVHLKILTNKVTVSIVVLTTLAINIFGWLQVFLPPSVWLMFGYTPYVSSYVDNKPLPFYHGIAENFDLVRVNSTLSGPNQFGAYICFIILLLIPVLRAKTLPKWLKLMTILTLASSVCMLVLTFSRSAWIGFIAGLFILVLIQVKRNSKYILVGLTLVGIIAGLGAWYTFGKSSFETYIVHGASTSERMVAWQKGIDIIRENPFGLGLGQAGPVSRRLYGEEKAIISENWYMQIAEETGILSSVLFISIFICIIAVLYELHKKSTSETTRSISLGLLIGILSICINALFLHTWDDTTLAYISLLLTGLYVRRYDDTVFTTTTLKSKVIKALFKQQKDE